MKLSLGKRILQRMLELGIKSNVKLADKMNRRVHPYTIGKWIAGKSNPRGDNLLALAKALEIRAELLILEEGQDSDELKSLERIVSKIVEAETKKLLKETKSNLERELVLFLKSDKIPQEDKDIILSQVKRLLERYKEVD